MNIGLCVVPLCVCHACLCVSLPVFCVGMSQPVVGMTLCGLERSSERCVCVCVCVCVCTHKDTPAQGQAGAFGGCGPG